MAFHVMTIIEPEFQTACCVRGCIVPAYKSVNTGTLRINLCKTHMHDLHGVLGWVVSTPDDQVKAVAAEQAKDKRHFVAPAPAPKAHANPEEFETDC